MFCWFQRLLCRLLAWWSGRLFCWLTLIHEGTDRRSYSRHLGWNFCLAAVAELPADDPISRSWLVGCVCGSRSAAAVTAVCAQEADVIIRPGTTIFAEPVVGAQARGRAGRNDPHSTVRAVSAEVAGSSLRVVTESVVGVRACVGAASDHRSFPAVITVGADSTPFAFRARAPIIAYSITRIVTGLGTQRVGSKVTQ